MNVAHQAGFEPTTPAFGGQSKLVKYQVYTNKINWLVSA